jgi:hypothetical protein
MLRLAAPTSPIAVAILLSHTTRYTADEESTFRHVRHYLGRHDKYVVMPDSHAGIYPGLASVRLRNRLFGAARPHPALLRSEAFYRAFRAYEFLFVCHLDARICSDRLIEWCGAGYDCLPGPGFSIRRVSSFLRVLDARRSSLRSCVEALLPLGAVQWYDNRRGAGCMPEERFWSDGAAGHLPSFRIAPPDVAARLTSEPASEALRHGPASEVRLRAPREARAWEDVERRFLRLSHRPLRA